MNSYTSATTKPLYHGVRIVWFLLGLIEILLAFRFALKFFGANPGAAFTNLIYSASAIFAAPFGAVFGVTQVAGSVFEWTTLLAMFVYWIVAIGVVNLFLMGKTVSTPEAAVRLQEEETK